MLPKKRNKIIMKKKHKTTSLLFVCMISVLVQFTEDLLHLQDCYVKQLENKTNARPGKYHIKNRGQFYHES